MNDAFSNQKLALVNPALAAKVNAAADFLAMEGIYFRVAQGLRTFEAQEALYEQGRRTPGPIVTHAQPGYSNHNFGCAVDCFPFLTGASGPLEMNDSRVPVFRAMVAALRAQGLAWGGDWKEPDCPHFQLENVPETPGHADWEAFATGGLDAVWKLYPQESI